MIKNETLKKILPSSILLNPIGKNGNEIWIEDFEQLYPLFFKSVLEIQKADISEFSGFGEFSENGIPEFSTFKDFFYYYRWVRHFFQGGKSRISAPPG